MVQEECLTLPSVVYVSFGGHEFFSKLGSHEVFGDVCPHISLF